MKARHPIWNILFILGVLYVIVFGFLYVYMQQNSSAAQASETTEESEAVAREVDIIDAPLLTEQDAALNEAEVAEAEVAENADTNEITDANETSATNLNQTSTDTADEASLEPDASGESSLSTVDDTVDNEAPSDETSVNEPTTNEASSDDASGDVPASDEAPDTALSELADDEAEEASALSDAPADVEADIETVTEEGLETDLETSGSAPSGSESESESAVADAEAQEVLGSSEPYRYNLNEMARNTKIETEQGWVTFEGTVETPQASERYFLIVQSLLREPPTLFSQGEISLDDNGSFEARAKYATYSEFYKTYLISTADDEAADSFADEGSSSGLPSGFKAVRPEVEVLVD